MEMWGGVRVASALNQELVLPSAPRTRRWSRGRRQALSQLIGGCWADPLSTGAVIALGRVGNISVFSQYDCTECMNPGRPSPSTKTFTAVHRALSPWVKYLYQ